MSSLSQASRLADLPSAHDAFQGHAAHIIEWPTMLRPKDSEGTCIPSGVTTFLQTASRRSSSSEPGPPLHRCIESLPLFFGQVCKRRFKCIECSQTPLYFCSRLR